MTWLVLSVWCSVLVLWWSIGWWWVMVNAGLKMMIGVEESGSGGNPNWREVRYREEFGLMVVERSCSDCVRQMEFLGPKWCSFGLEKMVKIWLNTHQHHITFFIHFLTAQLTRGLNDGWKITLGAAMINVPNVEGNFKIFPFIFCDWAF